MPEMDMANRQLVERAFNAMNRRDFDLLGNLHSENHQYRDPRCPDLGRGYLAVRRVNQALADAAPDVQYTIDALTENGDEVHVRWTARATIQGHPGRTLPPSSPTEVAGETSLRLADGKIIETRHRVSIADLILGLTGDPTQGRCP